MLIISIFTSLFFQATAFDIYDVENTKYISINQLADEVGRSDQVTVLGEWHYNVNIQLAQTEVIRQTAKETPMLAMEFLNQVDAKKIAVQEQLLRDRKISVQEFTDQIFGKQRISEYHPLYNLVPEMKAQLLATNYTRAQKRPVVRGGIDALDPSLLPEDFALGSDNYYERFLDALGGGGGHGNLDNYYAAQCLTDDVIAKAIADNATGDVSPFLIIGAFHSEYQLGVVERLWVRMPKHQVQHIRFLRKSDLEGKSIQEVATHPKYGDLAHFLVIVD